MLIHYVGGQLTKTDGMERLSPAIICKIYSYYIKTRGWMDGKMMLAKFKIIYYTLGQ